jgi:hypothetical protein
MQFRFSKALPLALAVLTTLSQAAAQAPVPSVDHVVHISVDGLRPDVVTALGADRLPNFYRFRTEGAWTDNARADQDLTYTLPNHTTQITGRHAFGDGGHGWFWNSDPGPFTLHTRGYVASAFDTVHDRGGATALYAGKDKFVLFERSYDAASGAPDEVGTDDGRDKIDAYRYDSDMAALTAAFTADLRQRQFDYTLFHFRHPDGVGHAEEWQVDPATAYAQKVEEIDGLLGQILAVIETTPGLAGRTALVLTADHGGDLGTTGHGNPLAADNYTVPFYVWGPGVAMGADLYALNPTTRRDPGTGRPSKGDAIQPVRNGDAANLALALLGLPPIPGSRINAKQDLGVAPLAGQTVRVFQQGLNGYAGTVDTYVRRHERSSSYGSRSSLVVDDADPWWSGRDNQALVRFENVVGDGAGQVPAGAEVQRATLSLRVFDGGDGGAAHRMLRPWSADDSWDDLSGGISADDREAQRTPDDAAGDVDEGTLTFDVTEGVRAFVDGAANYGWALLPDGGNGWDAYSAEGYMPPRLVVAYGYQAYAPEAAPGATEVALAAETPPERVELLGTWPNPFSHTATIGYRLPTAGPVRLEVFDVRGRLVATLAEGTREAGGYEARFEASGLAPGLYVVRLTAGGSVLSGRMTLVR